MPDKSSVHIGHQLQQAHRKKGYTQAEVSKHVNTTVNHYAKIERGEVMPSLRLLKKSSKRLA